MWLFTSILCCLFITGINGYGQLNETLIKDVKNVDPDLAPYMRVVDGRDVVMFRAFQNFEIDIKLSEIDQLVFLYGNKELDHSKFSALSCDRECFLIFNISNEEQLICKLGYGIGSCNFPHNKYANIEFDKFFFTPGYQKSPLNFSSIIRAANYYAFNFAQTEKDGQKSIRASIHCIDIRWKYTDENKPNICSFGLFSTNTAHPFVTVVPKKKEFRFQKKSNKTLIYNSTDLESLPAMATQYVSFYDDGWPKIRIERHGFNQRYTFIKPGNVQNFPGIFFDFDWYFCYNGGFTVRLFDDDDCKFYVVYNHHTSISKIRYEDPSMFYLNTNISNWIMYFNSPNVRFADRSMNEFYESRDFLLCDKKVEDRFAIEIIPNLQHHCNNISLVTGPEVQVEIEIPDEMFETTPSIDTKNSTLANISESPTTEPPEDNLEFPLIFGCLATLLLILLSTANCFLIRRKWFKDSRAALLLLNDFERHWQFIIPPSEPLNNNDNDNNDNEHGEEE